MPSRKMPMISDEMRKAVSEALRNVKDPRVGEGLLSVIACDVSADYKYAKIYYSLYGGDAGQTKQGLKSALGFIRREVARTLNLRVTPELLFIADSSIEHGSKIAGILKELGIKPEEPQA